MKLSSLRVLALIGFVVMAAVAAVLGCPFFRNPANYASAGGFVGAWERIVTIHRKR